MSKVIEGLPGEYYTDPAIFHAERRNVFARNWLYAAHESELPAVGDFVSVDIAGYPFLLIRQQDNSISCFQNLCRHRAAPLVSTDRGTIESGTLTCRYHGWSYSCSGELVGAPYLEGLTECNRAELSLASVQAVTYRGLIFVKLSLGKSTPSTFEEDHAELIETINASDCDLESYTFHSKMTRSGNFNWKVWLEGYQECYHCPTTHPIFNRDFRLQKYRVENRNKFSVHSCERKISSTSGGFNGLWLWIYPNLGMPVYEPCFYTLQVNPDSVNRTTLTYSFHVRKGTDEGTIAEFRQFVDQITEEDINICEAVQKNLASGLCKTTRLNAERENGVEYFHSLLRADMQRQTDASARPVSDASAPPKSLIERVFSGQTAN